MIPRLVIASKNPDKVNEIAEILKPSDLADEIVVGLDWPPIEETGSSLEENALLKARAVVACTGLPALADDTGLEVMALDRGPGVHTSRFAGPDASYRENVDKLLTVMDGVEDRRARFRTVAALAFPDGVEVTAEGELSGVITGKRRGTDGFGYDPIFDVRGRTLAEMADAEKNALSHRARAIRALLEELGL